MTIRLFFNQNMRFWILRTTCSLNSYLSDLFRNKTGEKQIKAFNKFYSDTTVSMAQEEKILNKITKVRKSP